MVFYLRRLTLLIHLNPPAPEWYDGFYVLFFQRNIMENHKILAEVLPHVMYPHYNENLTDSALSLLDEFLQQIPVISLECTPCADAVDVLYNCLETLI